MLQQGEDRKAGCSAKTRQFAHDLTEELAALIRATLTPIEWDAVRRCEGVHAPLTWEEKHVHNKVGKGAKAMKIQKSFNTRCQSRSMHWKSAGMVTEIRQWDPVKWSKDDWVQGYKAGRSRVTTPWPPEIDPFTTNREVDIAMVEENVTRVPCERC